MADESFDDLDDDQTPVDLSAVHADDQLLDALAGDGIVDTQSEADYRLASLLAGWRADVLAEPMDFGPTLEQVELEIAVAAKAQTRRKSLRRLRIVSAAAAVVAIAFGGITIAAHDAKPGDALWGVKQAMFGSDATQTMTVQTARSELKKAQQAFDRGDRDAAITHLNNAIDKVGEIKDRNERQNVQNEIDRLWGLIYSQGSTGQSGGGTEPQLTDSSSRPSPRSSTVSSPQKPSQECPTPPSTSNPTGTTTTKRKQGAQTVPPGCSTPQKPDSSDPSVPPSDKPSSSSSSSSKPTTTTTTTTTTPVTR